MSSIRIHQFPNGFRVVTEVMPALKSAAVGVWVGAGGRHERLEQNGIAHFLEHMAFKGTKRRSALQIAEEIEDVGGYINAYTSREATAFYARVLGADVALALDVIGDIVLHPVFNAGEIEIERGVILSEIGQTQDTPDDVIFDRLQEVCYPDQPLGRTILGPTERVSAFGRDDFTDFVAQNYGPSRMILAASGAVDHAAIVAQAGEIFGSIPPKAHHPETPAHFKGGEVRDLKPLEQAHFTLAFESPHYRDPNIYATQIFAIALGGGMSSRLFQEIREKRGLCYSIFATAGAYHDTGTFTIYAGTSGDKVRDLASLTIDEIKCAADDMSQVELNRARAQMKAGLLMGLESPSARAERLARMLGIWNRVPELDEIIAKIEAVNLQQVRQIAADMCMPQVKLATAAYGPVEKALDLAQMQARLVA